MRRHLRPTVLGLMLAAAPLLATLAQTSVQDAWVRGTVAHQTASGMFAKVTSSAGGRLVAASSPVARVVEIRYPRRRAPGVSWHAWLQGRRPWNRRQ